MDDSWHVGLAAQVDASPAQRTRGRIRGAFQPTLRLNRCHVVVIGHSFSQQSWQQCSSAKMCSAGDATQSTFTGCHAHDQISATAGAWDPAAGGGRPLSVAQFPLQHHRTRSAQTDDRWCPRCFSLACRMQHVARRDSSERMSADAWDGSQAPQQCSAMKGDAWHARSQQAA